MNCPNCNSQLDPGTRFCYRCGAPVPQQQANQQYPTQSQGRQPNQQIQNYQQSGYDEQAFYQGQPSIQAPAKKSPVAICFAVIFAILSLSLAGTTLFLYNKYNESQEVIADYKEKLDEAQKLTDEYKEELDEAQKLIGEYNGENDSDEVAYGEKISYIEQQNRMDDVSMAEYLRESLLADIADNREIYEGSASMVVISDSYLPSSINEVPTIRAKKHRGEYFIASWNSSWGCVDVYDSTGQYLLTDPQGASDYKNNVAPGEYRVTTE